MTPFMWKRMQYIIDRHVRSEEENIDMMDLLIKESYDDLTKKGSDTYNAQRIKKELNKKKNIRGFNISFIQKLRNISEPIGKLLRNHDHSEWTTRFTWDNNWGNDEDDMTEVLVTLAVFGPNFSYDLYIAVSMISIEENRAPKSFKVRYVSSSYYTDEIDPDYKLPPSNVRRFRKQRRDLYGVA